MGSSRKRKRVATVCSESKDGPARKEAKQAVDDSKDAQHKTIRHVVLRQYFSQISTLKDYVLSKLPSSSKIRRKKISAACEAVDDPDAPDVERAVGALLTSTLVTATDEPKSVPDDRWEKWTTFSQKGDESYVTLSDGLAGAVFSQSEMVDFVIWLLFSKTRSTEAWPKHLLCDGYRRDPRGYGSVNHGGNSIPGLFSVYPNQQVQTLKEAPWPQLLKLLGKTGDRIMLDLLLDCAIFMPVNTGQGNYWQISGTPLSEFRTLEVKETQESQSKDFERSPSDLTFVRNRILYARAALNARGLVHFGLRHIHVLNRCPYVEAESHSADAEKISRQNEANTLKVMMYMFPRQFGLHNVFTSKVNFRETSQRLKDYTLREQEILEKLGRLGDAQTSKCRTPKRLRGKLKALVRRLQVLHGRCSYSQLIEHYCPVADLIGSSGAAQSRSSAVSKLHRSPTGKQARTSTQLQLASRVSQSPQPASIMGLATPVAQVSAFCRAMVSKVIPNEFWGTAMNAKQNKDIILKKIDRFIHLRRFESMSLHEVIQGMKITDIEWLAPPCLRGNKTSQTDIRKRAELFSEFLYYVFDSILIPLLRNNFYITESSAHKYRLFFFRHDVWRYVAEPAMASLKTKMFEEVPLGTAIKILESRQLGFSQIRLLPKEVGIRPIMNLRRRQVMRGNRRLLGPSINIVLGPVQTVLQLEKATNPEILGAAMFSVGEIHERVKAFKARLGRSGQQFFFAKVDVKSAFDTIPQSAIVGLINSIPQQREYIISKHAEISSNQLYSTSERRPSNMRPSRKWLATAMGGRDATTFPVALEQKEAVNKRNTIFVDSVFKKHYETSDLLKLVATHIQQNLVRIGKKYYRQKQGIPQGSVLSSILCNYFYADLENQVLNFLHPDDSLLLRLIDDFLLITTDQQKAAQFVRVMHCGVPEYGVSVNPAKTLVNFDLTVGDKAIAKPASDSFSYCGTLINCKTLDITRDHSRDKEQSIYDSLTVEHTRTPGQTFQRKVMNAFKIQSHLMYLDTSLNSSHTMLKNLHNAFLETATKMWAYARCLPPHQQLSADLTIRTIAKLVDVAYVLATSKARKLRYPGYQCDVSKTEVAWLAYDAFTKILTRKQASYQGVLAWVRMQIGKLSTTKEIRRGRVSRMS